MSSYFRGITMINMNVKTNEDKIAEMTLGGNLNVTNTVTLHNKIVEIFDKVEELSISLEKVTDMDMTFMQLLCAAHKAFAQSGKHFKISGDLASISEKAASMGYTRQTGCTLDKQNSCVLVKVG